MAQLKTKYEVICDLEPARRAVRRVMREADAANRELAIAEEQLARVQAEHAKFKRELASLGIRLELEEVRL